MDLNVIKTLESSLLWLLTLTPARAARCEANPHLYYYYYYYYYCNYYSVPIFIDSATGKRMIQACFCQKIKIKSEDT